jgi:hypothetical protein
VAACLAVGDRADTHHGARPARFEVAGIYREYGNDRGTALLNRAVYGVVAG